VNARFGLQLHPLSGPATRAVAPVQQGAVICPVMAGKIIRKKSASPRWIAWTAIAVTLLACIAALWYRAPLRGRYWAGQLARSDSPQRRAALLAALCNLGSDARWGVQVLLDEPDAATRQLGVIALQHIDAPWARARLVALLDSADESELQRLAALGLARHGDDQVIPTLLWLYRTGESDSARLACLALERLGTPAAVAALFELAAEPADAARRSALVDALATLDRPAAVPALLRLLEDERPLVTPTLADETRQRVLADLVAEGSLPPVTAAPATAPAERSIAAHAAAALARITGRHPSAAESWDEWDAAQRADVAADWAAWQAARQPADPTDPARP
jgi:hypothetical protein